MQTSRRTVVIIFLLILSGFVPLAGQFRGHEWGTTMEEVRADEGEPISEFIDTYFLTGNSMKYELEIYGEPCEATYYFDQSAGLFRGEYDFGSAEELSIGMFLGLDSLLVNIYGLPTKSFSRNETLPYFDWSIVRSNEAVERGVIRWYSEWWLEDTVIRHSLHFQHSFMPDFTEGPIRPYHTIEYRSRTIMGPWERRMSEGL